MIRSYLQWALCGAAVTLLLLASTACNQSKAVVAEPAPANIRSDACPAPEGDPQARFEAGNKRMKQGKMGDMVRTVDRQAALKEYLAAARGGHAMAQYLFGLRSVFDRFQEDSPDLNDPKEKAVYIQGLKWIAVAAARGLPRARKAFSPWVIEVLTNPQAEVKPDEEDALAALPMVWMQEAARQAHAMRDCWPAVTP